MRLVAPHFLLEMSLHCVDSSPMLAMIDTIFTQILSQTLISDAATDLEMVNLPRDKTAGRATVLLDRKSVV